MADVSRLLLINFFVCSAALAQVVVDGADIIPISYGTSYQNNHECRPYFVSAGVPSENVWTVARAGAPSLDWASDAISRRCILENAYLESECYDLVRQIVSLDGECRREPVDLFGDAAPEETCLDRLPTISGLTPILDGVVNDVTKGTTANADSVWTGNLFPAIQSTWLTEIMPAIRSKGVPCVVVSNFPIEGIVDSRRQLRQRDARDWMRDSLMPLYPECEFVDAIQLVDDFGAVHGEAARLDLYVDCDVAGNPSSCSDGTHPGRSDVVVESVNYGSGLDLWCNAVVDAAFRANVNHRVVPTLPVPTLFGLVLVYVLILGIRAFPF